MNVKLLLKILTFSPEYCILLVLFQYKQLSLVVNNKPSLNAERKQKLIKLVEFIVITVATWINPDATLAIAALKLCFLVLDYLQRSHLQNK